jgi:enamine deaminase RidA (YjgF/YER057c/UK114 family)
MTIQRRGTERRLSQVVEHGETIYLSGQVADDPSGDVSDQTRQILDKIDLLLAQAGSDRTRLLSANIWLAVATDFAAMSELWEAWIPEGSAPARTTVQATLVLPVYKIEITVIAAK